MLCCAFIVAGTSLVSCSEEHYEFPEPNPDGIPEPGTYVMAMDGDFWAAGPKTAPVLLGNAAPVAPSGPNLGSMILSYGVDILDRYVKGKAVSALDEFINGLLFAQPVDSTGIKLNEIINKLDAIKQQLDYMQSVMESIQQQVDEVEFNAFKSEYWRVNSEQYALREHNMRYYYMLQDATTDEENARLLDKWANTIINGNPAYMGGQMLIYELTTWVRNYHQHAINLTGVYDMIVYDNYAWEHEGYGAQEEYRAVLATDFLLAQTLAYAYYCREGDTRSADKAIAFLEDGIKYLDGNAVKYHNDKAICQIQDTHFELNNDNPFIDKSEFNSGTTGSVFFADIDEMTLIYQNNQYPGLTSTVKRPDGKDVYWMKDLFLMSQFTSQEVQNLIAYYKDTCPALTFLGILQEKGGVKLSWEFQPNYAISDGNEFATVRSHINMQVQESHWRFWDKGSATEYTQKWTHLYRVDIPMGYKINYLHPMGPNKNSSKWANFNAWDFHDINWPIPATYLSTEYGDPKPKNNNIHEGIQFYRNKVGDSLSKDFYTESEEYNDDGVTTAKRKQWRGAWVKSIWAPHYTGDYGSTAVLIGVKIDNLKHLD